MWYDLVSERAGEWNGIAIVCLPIWHWYMLRGDWLKSQKGVSEAIRDSMAHGASSQCVWVSRFRSSSPYAMRRVVCSSGEMISVRRRLTLRTGRSGRAGFENSKSAGARRDPPGRMSAISSV
eukprot:1362978-Pleurochrysis_carterae.AAC.1